MRCSASVSASALSPLPRGPPARWKSARSKSPAATAASCATAIACLRSRLTPRIGAGSDAPAARRQLGTMPVALGQHFARAAQGSRVFFLESIRLADRIDVVLVGSGAAAPVHVLAAVLVGEREVVGIADEDGLVLVRDLGVLATGGVGHDAGAHRLRRDGGRRLDGTRPAIVEGPGEKKRQLPIRG